MYTALGCPETGSSKPRRYGDPSRNRKFPDLRPHRTARYPCTAAGFPGGVGTETSSFPNVRGRDDHQWTVRVAIAAVGYFVRIAGSAGISAAPNITGARNSPCFSGYSYS